MKIVDHVIARLGVGRKLRQLTYPHGPQTGVYLTVMEAHALASVVEAADSVQERSHYADLDYALEKLRARRGEAR